MLIYPNSKASLMRRKNTLLHFCFCFFFFIQSSKMSRQLHGWTPPLHRGWSALGIKKSHRLKPWLPTPALGTCGLCVRGKRAPSGPLAGMAPWLRPYMLGIINWVVIINWKRLKILKRKNTRRTSHCKIYNIKRWTFCRMVRACDSFKHLTDGSIPKL